ncbi:APC family permease [Streptomyces sp. NPDC047043]|uniref:APC family permease n=1 Tax=Streptomyces sp. NPDC047043 TaxID=3154497 RepID=UPI00340CC0EE
MRTGNGGQGRPARPTVAGLRRRSIGAPELTAQSVAVTAPTLSTAAGPASVAAVTGGGAALSYVIATAVMLLVAYCVSQYTRRVVATGSLYTYAALGFGPRAAFLAGIGLIIGYGVLAMAAMLLSASHLVHLLPHLGLHIGGTPLIGATAALLALAAVGCGLLGITVTARASLAIEVTAIALVVGALLALAVSGGAHLDLAHVLRPAPDWHGGVLGVVLALTSFVGFESSSALSVEGRRPQVSVARAMLRTVCGAGLLYVLAAALQPRDSGTPLLDLLRTLDPPWVSVLAEVGVAASAFACMSGSITALVRLLFALGREGVLPEALGRVRVRHGTPHIALGLSAVSVITVPAGMLLAGVTVDTAVDQLATLATFGYLLAYVVVSLSTPLFLRRIGELTRPTALAGPLAAALMATAILLYSSPLVPDGHHGVVRLFLGLVVAGMAWYLPVLLRRPELVEHVGIRDVPVAADFYDPADLDALSGTRRP